jgi:acetyl/propionyl-CoA carboxylase alpha subunit
MFKKILIAARGEIVLRIARTCERMGIATVGVHSESETGAPHVGACDEAVCVGGPAPRDSYLNTAALLAAAKQTGAQAIHPGCGVLSQNPGFARAAADAGLALIGPGAETLGRFSNAPASRELARMAGVRALAHAPIETNGGRATLFEQAREIGYPLLIRASAEDAIAEPVDEEAELTQAIGRCRDRTMAGCDDPRIHVEPYLDRPRLLAVVVMADARGDCVALGELERCVDRPLASRILLEESPAPALVGLPNGVLKRQALWDAATRVAREGGVIGPAIAEFVLDCDNRLAFTRLRAGLPLEHALCEMSAGLDLVEAQIEVAAGGQLPAAVRNAQPSGNAVQARLATARGGERQSDGDGALETLRWPVMAPGTLRVETDLAAGARPGTDYDPLVARVIAYGQTRHQALLTLDRVLAEATIEPLTTNLALLRRILADESFRAGQYDAEFVERMSSELTDHT